MRREYKYLVPIELYERVKEKCLPFLAADQFSRECGRYTVRSIYFDSSMLRFYHEKLAGARLRKKLRIRGYDDQQNNSTVFLEIKRKIGDRIAKSRAPVPFATLRALLDSGMVEDYVAPQSGHPAATTATAAQRFLFHMYREALRPVVLVIYDREAYFYRFNHNIRVTFDLNLRSSIAPKLDCLFQENSLRYTLKSYFILEVKFYHNMPDWIKSLIATHSLPRMALSKYTMTIDTHRNVEGELVTKRIIKPPPRKLE